MNNVLVFDIGGTKISYSIVNQRGEFVSDVKKISTPKTTVDIYNTLKKIIETEQRNFDLIAVATAGCVNKDNTKISGSTGNMPQGYKDFDFASLSKDKKIFVENDANAAAWAEYKVGTAIGFENSITITLGTGVGGGIIVDGVLLKGSKGLAGEVGSIKISLDTMRKCTCGNFDCWESYASGTGFKITAQNSAKIFGEFKTSIFADKNFQDITTYDILSGVEKKDLFSEKVFDLWNYHIYCGLLSLVNIFNPEIIVLSGGLGSCANYKWLEAEINKHSVVSEVKVFPSILQNNTGMVGAALLALKKYSF